MTFHLHFMLGLLVFLILLSAFFSGSETAMMSLNRYRLRHLARKGKASAQRMTKLLERPDRLLGVILIGNTFANILASAIATIIAVHYFKDLGILVATTTLTLVILIFAETAPKTYAALHPERIAYPAAAVLRFLLLLLYPLVWLVNGIANALLRMLRIRVRKRTLEPLSAEELRSVVHEATGKISSNYQKMLLRILDLEQVTVEDAMIPRNEIHGIDLNQDWNKILQDLRQSEHAYLPLYYDHINQVQGMVNLRKVLIALKQEKFVKEDLIALAEKTYFIPEGALLNKQLLHFQEQQKSIGLVVDEYGEIHGLVTLQDILEEIVGEFALGEDHDANLVRKQKDGSYLVSGNINIRDLNRLMDWTFSIEGPKTLSGLVIDYLEVIPKVGVGCRIAGYPIEVLEVSHNQVKLLRVWPGLHRFVVG